MREAAQNPEFERALSGAWTYHRRLDDRQGSRVLSDVSIDLLHYRFYRETISAACACP